MKAILKNNWLSALLVIVFGSIVTIGAFMATLWFFYIVLKFEDPIAAGRVALNVGIIVLSYVFLGGLVFLLVKVPWQDTIKAALVPALLTINIEFVMNLTLVTGFDVPLFLIDAVVIIGVLALIKIKKLPWIYYLGTACGATWHLLFVLMMGG